MQAVGLNGTVGVEPAEYKGVEKISKGGFTQIDQKSRMRGLKVIFGNTTGISPGDTVWVKETSIQHLSKAVFDVGGVSVMICPVGNIEFVTTAPVD